jgi:hypothetical protein
MYLAHLTPKLNLTTAFWETTFSPAPFSPPTKGSRLKNSPEFLETIVAEVHLMSLFVTGRAK